MGCSCRSWWEESATLGRVISRQSKPVAWSAMPIQSAAQPSAPASAARALAGVLFCCERCAAMTCCSLLRVDAREECRGRFVVQMAEAPDDALLERPRIVALREQRRGRGCTRARAHRSRTGTTRTKGVDTPMSVSTPRRSAPSPTTNCTGSRASCGTGNGCDRRARRSRSASWLSKP